MAGVRLKIVCQAQNAMEFLDRTKASLPALEELSLEGTRLHEALNAPNGTLYEAAYEAAYREELLGIYRRVEGGLTGNATSGHCADASPRTEPNVREELERAWTRDQADILMAHGDVLYQVIYAELWMRGLDLLIINRRQSMLSKMI